MRELLRQFGDREELTGYPIAESVAAATAAKDGLEAYRSGIAEYPKVKLNWQAEVEKMKAVMVKLEDAITEVNGYVGCIMRAKHSKQKAVAKLARGARGEKDCFRDVFDVQAVPDSVQKLAGDALFMKLQAPEAQPIISAPYKTVLLDQESLM